MKKIKRRQEKGCPSMSGTLRMMTMMMMRRRKRKREREGGSGGRRGEGEQVGGQCLSQRGTGPGQRTVIQMRARQGSLDVLKDTGKEVQGEAALE